MLKPFFRSFDAEKTVDKYYAWKGNKTHKYGPLIDYLRVIKGLTDDEIKQEILAYWDKSGDEAAEIGTRVHEECQCLVEALAAAAPAHVAGGRNVPRLARRPVSRAQPEPAPAVARRVDHRVHARRPPSGLWRTPSSPARSTSCCARPTRRWRGRSTSTGASTTRRRTRRPSITRPAQSARRRGRRRADYRRTARKAARSASLRPTTSVKYTAQLNCYGLMAALKYGVDFRAHMYLLQINDNEQYLPTTFARCRAWTSRWRRSSRWRRRGRSTRSRRAFGGEGGAESEVGRQSGVERR